MNIKIYKMNAKPATLPELPPKGLYSEKSTMEMLGVSRTTLRRKRLTGEILCSPKGAHIYYSGKEITKYYYNH